MAGRRWTSDHVEAVLYAAGGLFLAIFLPLGVGMGGSGGLVFVAVVVVVFALLAWRAWRKADAAADAPSVTATRRDVAPRPQAPPAPEPLGQAQRPPAGSPVGAPPRLSDDGRRTLARLVAVLAEAGLFAPRVPDPAALEETVADRGEPVDLAGVLSAPEEAPYWHPGFRPEDHLGALAGEGWKGEQLPETLHAMIAGLARLVTDVLDVRLAALELTAEGRFLRHRLTLVLGGERVDLDYLGAHKWLSTVPHVAVARAVRATGAPVRLASYGDDQTMWTVALRDGVTVERLNADLGLVAPDAWEWVDEQEPLVAGDLWAP